MSFSSYARPQDCDSPLGERPQAEALLSLCCVRPSFSRDLPTVLFLLPSLGGVCVCGRGNGRGPATQAATPERPTAWSGLLRKQQRWASFPSACPSTTCSPLCTGTWRPSPKHKAFPFIYQLQNTFFQEELGKSSSEECSFGLESYPYLALPVIHASRLMFSFECSRVVYKHKLYSLAYPCCLLTLPHICNAWL